MENPTSIAIIGMGCRLPGGADNPEQLWNMLEEGRSGWCEVPGNRWNWKSFYHPDSAAKESLNFKSAYFIPQDITAFDARFFGIPPREAEGMDPQQRLLLETSFEAIENAGIPIDSLRGSDTSVYVAIFAQDYDRMGYKDLQKLHKLHVTGKGGAILSNRISYLLDLKGPSMTIDTGCSGSMVALHQACQSIRTGESKVAIVGASQLMLHPDQSISMNQIGMMNPDGRCYVFDDRGSGYARGEGAGAVVLKRLDLALQDGDPIHGVIVNSGVNQDGKTLGIQLPNADSQEALARSVYAAAGIDPGQTLYVEAHGTGTKAGDAAEMASISKVFCEDPKRQERLLVGSVKSNIGHLESVSGIAGLLKAVMILKKGIIPPNIDFINPKPSLKLVERNITIPTQPTPLVPIGHTGPHRVSLNGFGYGGTNCHIILESLTDSSNSNGVLSNGHTVNSVNGSTVVNDSLASNHDNNGIKAKSINGLSNGTTHHLDESDLLNGNAQSMTAQEDKPHLFVLSAASQASLSSMASSLKDWVSNHQSSSICLRDLAHTLGVRRSLYSWRSSFVATSLDEVVSELGQVGSRGTKESKKSNLAYIFTGQGAQWFAMGRELLLTSPRFRESVAKSDNLLKSLGCPWSLIDELLKTKGDSKIGNSEIAQPATTALQVALVDLLDGFGIVPQRVCGHSSGEIAAAYAAGALNHEAAIEISYHRGVVSALAKTSNDCPGSMLAVGAGESDILPYLKNIKQGKIIVACENSPQSCTISGDAAAIDELSGVLESLSIFNRKLNVDTAYHSHHMETVSDRYAQSIKNVQHSAPKDNVKFFSSVTGKSKTADFGPQYWTSNLVSKVKFSEALSRLAEDVHASDANSDDMTNAFVEIGPHSALMGPSRQILAKISVGSFKYRYLSALTREKHAVKTTLALAGELLQAGRPVDIYAVLNLNQSTEKPSVIHDLPTYPWDHSSTYWNESRLSREHRLRQFPHHDLLGTLDVSSNVYEPRWRYHISTDSLPWLWDHQVDGFVIFPGSGYLCMAIEAMNQIIQIRKTTGTESVKRFVLRNVTFSSSIVIPEQKEVEVQLSLSSIKSDQNIHWEAFRIFSYHDDSWTENCSGLISVEMTGAADEVDGNREENLSKETLFKDLEDIKSSSRIEFDASEVYDSLKSSGNVFGPTFRAMTSIKIGDSQAFSTVVIPDVVSIMPASYMQPHVIHPTTFDALNQLAAVLFKEQCSNSPVMPVFMREVTVSTDIGSTPGMELLVALRMTSKGLRTAEGDTWVLQVSEQDEMPRPVVTASGWQLRAIGEAASNKESVPFHRKMSYKMDWQADVNHLTNEMFHDRIAEVNLFDVPAQNGGTSAELEIPLNEKAAAIYMQRALRGIGNGGDQITAPHLIKLFDWMRLQLESETACQYLRDMTDGDEETIQQQSIEAGIMGKLLSRIGMRLPEILRGEADPLAIMIQDNLLHKFYAESVAVSSSLQLAKYVELLAFKKPRMNILEIGAGTGSATLPLLQALTSPEDVLLHRYHYTDISAGFFEQARTKFAEWKDKINFQPLDISSDPLAQGYSESTYDLIVASNVIHATPTLDTTMTNIKKLLKPGGRVAFIEVNSGFAAVNMIFGSLPGWWLSEDGRKDTPLLSVPQWHDVLIRNGFNGVEIETPDHVESDAMTNMIVSRLVDKPVVTKRNPGKVAILREYNSTFTNGLSNELLTFIGEKGLNGQATALKSIEVDLEATYIVLDCAERALLMGPSQEEFDSIKDLLTKGQNILWVSFQESDAPQSTASKGLITGMARVMRRENGAAKLVTLDVQDNTSTISSVQLAKALTEVAESCFWSDVNNDWSNDLEYSYKNGSISIPRLRTDDKFDNWADSITGNNSSQVEVCIYKDKARPLMLEAETPGLLSSLRFVDDPMPAETLAPDQIQVEAYAYGINFKDVFVALGQTPPEVTMVGEFAGVVTAVGADFKEVYQVGDRVAGIGGEPYSSYPRMKALECQKFPDSLSFVDAASVVAVFYTAWYSIEYIARLQRGQSILIHAASGGVGQAAIQFAQHIGAEVFVTMGSLTKRKLVMDRYNIPESHIFSSRSTTFKQGIMRLTGNKGVDVVLNSLSGEALASSWECIANFGTFLEIGKTDIYKRRNLSMAQFDKSVIFAAVDIALLTKKRPEMIHSGLKHLFKMFEDGILTTVHPVTTFPMDQVEQAFRLIATRKHTGKLVMVVDEQAQVKTQLLKPAPLQLDRNGTYVVAGGLGDLGRKICGLLASKGAGHIVTLSRRTLGDEDRRLFEEQIEQLGSSLHILRCDISNNASILEAKSICDETLPPVRGIIHGGMVLRDRPLEFMTFEDYNTAISPKVYGTINLHDAFSTSNLAFFISLSSVSGVLGMTSQSNYAAGNTFQDAFAHAYSTANAHTRYITLDLGAIEGSDAITLLPIRYAELERQSVIFMTFDELFVVMEYSMGPQAITDGAVQCVLGFDRHSMEAIDDRVAMNNPLFSLLPDGHNKQSQTSKDAAADSTQGPGRALQDSKSMSEAEMIITKATADKFSAFLDSAVPTDVPISQLALDSLVSIELKNWMVRTFEAPLQSSELAGALSIAALAKLLASRSKFVSDEVRGVKNVEAGDGAEQISNLDLKAGEEQTNGESQHLIDSDIPEHGWACCKHAKELPRYPLADLDHALDYFVENTGHFFAPSEFEILEQAVEEMRGPAARRAYAEIVKKKDDLSLDSWMYDLISDAVYLKRTHSIAPYSNVMGTHFDSKVPHAQSERAAIIATSAWKFKHSVDTNRAEPFWYFGMSSCTWQWQWLFNATRIPRVGGDVMQMYESEYCVVLRRGHVFKVMLREDGEDVQYQKLKATFDAILEHVKDDGEWLGILTTDVRDSWAVMREKVLGLSPENVKYFDTIDAASFLICLDDGSPETDEERVKHAYFGDGFNRWQDKCTQFVVSANGRSSFIMEHGAIDGMTAARSCDWIHEAIQAHQPETVVPTVPFSAKSICLEEFFFKSAPEVDQHMTLLRERYLKNTAALDYRLHDITVFGTDYLIASKCPAKSVIDATLQLAIRLHFGYNTPSWEAVSMAHYHKGRPDIMNATTRPVVEFCDAVLDNDVPLVEKRAMLFRLGREMTANLNNCLAGNNHLRLFDLIDLLWPQDEPQALMFRDVLFWRNPFVMASHAPAGNSVCNSAYGLQEPNSFWIMITPTAQSVRFSVAGPSNGKTEAFGQCLNKAAHIIKQIVDADPKSEA